MTKNSQKRKLKTEPKLKIELNEEQKQVEKLLQTNDVVFVEGKWATGKTLSAVAACIKSYRKKEFDEIAICRPFLPDKALGALPGTLEEKLLLETQPIIENFDVCQEKSKTQDMLNNNEITIQYNGKIKGRTIQDAIMLIDEAEDLTYKQFVEILTRLGKRSKMIFVLSKEQIHKNINSKSCYYTLQKLKETDLVGWVELTENHRNTNINKIINYLET